MECSKLVGLQWFRSREVCPKSCGPGHMGGPGWKRFVDSCARLMSQQLQWHEKWCKKGCKTTQNTCECLLKVFLSSCVCISFICIILLIVWGLMKEVPPSYPLINRDQRFGHPQPDNETSLKKPDHLSNSHIHEVVDFKSSWLAPVAGVKCFCSQ